MSRGTVIVTSFAPFKGVGLSDTAVEAERQREMFGWVATVVGALLLLTVEICAEEETVMVQANEQCVSNSSNSATDINTALANISSDTTLLLDPGVHCLTEVAIVSDLDNITIAGLEPTATITCSGGAGLALVNISSLILRDVEIRGCGLTGEGLERAVNLTRELISLFFTVPATTQVGLFLACVHDLTMESVAITDTAGLGLVAVNVLGDSEITNCSFDNNRQQQKECAFQNTMGFVTDLGERIGGGAYFLFQDFTDATCIYLPVYSLTLYNCSFSGNSECSILPAIEVLYRESREARELGYTIGGGGGMAVMLAQACYAVNVTTSFSSFDENMATSGGAVHVGIFIGVSHSFAVFDNCQFSRNGYPSDIFQSTYPTNAGAISLYNNLASPDSDVNVFISDRRIGLVARNCNFTGNRATSGGAIQIISLIATAVSDLTDVAHFLIEGCVFSGNTAARGAAIFIQEEKLHGRLLGSQVRAHDLTVVGNRLETVGDIVSVSSSDASAVVAVNFMNLTLSGDCRFESNIGSAVMGASSLIGIAGNVSIINNTGLYGGGMILQTSFIVILPNSSLTVADNVARVYGGAFYINQIISSPLLTMFDCFLYFNYDQFDFCLDCDFTVSSFSVTVTNNTAQQAGTIFGSALGTCPWSVPLQQSYGTRNVLSILNTYYSDYFQFTPDPTGIGNVRTPVSKVLIEDKESEYTLAPGEIISLPVRPEDSLGQSISTILGVYVDLDQNVTQRFLPGLGASFITGYTANSNLSTPLFVLGAENLTTRLVIYGADFGYRPAQVEIKVYVGQCPIGFNYSNTTLRCECISELVERGVVCDPGNLTLRVPSQLWVGPVDQSTFAFADCIRGLCAPGNTNITVKNNSFDFDLQCIPELKRGGILCSSCLDGYTNVFGSPRCRKCPNWTSLVLILFLLLGALIIAFLVIFRINLSSGYLNGILFWANIVDLFENVLAPSQSQRAGVTVLAHWLTLNWGIETCFHEQMTALEQSWWELCFSLYLFVLMLILRMIFKCRQVKAKTAFATIEAFATLLIMCYISILQTSFQLIATVTIYTQDGGRLVRWMTDPAVPYFRGAHGFLAFVATILILTYIIPVPLLFLIPTLLYRNKYLKKFKPLYDAFWNPFKPRFRFWLGLRLICRWIPFIMAAFTNPPTSTFVTAFVLALLLFSQLQFQPFQSKWVNAIDSLFLLNLLLLFLGSLFYNASEEDSLRDHQLSIMRDATSYTIALVVLAYLGISAVFTYRILMRYPRVLGCLEMCYEKCCKKRMKKIVLHVPQSAPEEPEYTASSVVKTNPSIQDPMSPRVINHTSFREPLLDEGSVEIRTYTTVVPPSSPPPELSSSSPAQNPNKTT